MVPPMPFETEVVVKSNQEIESNRARLSAAKKIAASQIKQLEKIKGK